ncbi:MAG: transcriptional regulator [Flavobacteriales bacterium]|nr:MAG: transcriptional regulator [Flavobacteriales bacterium]
MKNNLKVWRAQNNITQQGLADAVGVSRQSINAIETGRYEPSTALSLKIAQVLKTRVENLFSLEDTDWEKN